MRYHLTIVHVVMIGLLLGGRGEPQAQTPPTAPADPAAELLSNPATPETVAARKAAVSAQLKALADSQRSEADLKAARAPLEQLLEVLTGLEGAWSRRETYTARLHALSQRVRDAKTEYQQVQTRPPRRFLAVTEQQRDDAQKHLKAAQEQLQQLTKTIAAGEVRLGALPKELETQSLAIPQAENDLRDTTGQTPDDTARLPTETQQWRLARLRAEVAALKAERDWLTKRSPLDDALVQLARLRLETMQRDLDTMRTTLESAIQQKQSTLSDQTAALERQLAEITDPVERLPLEVQLETVAIQHATADYRQVHNQLALDLRAQQSQTSRLQQRLDRLTSMAERYQGGEYMGQRLQDAFTHLQRKRQQYPYSRLVQPLHERRDALSAALFTLEGRLLDFNDNLQTRQAEFRTAFARMPAQQHEASVAQLRQAFEAQRLALREQQQVLVTVTQGHTELLAAYRQYKHQLNDTYVALVQQLFWIRDATPLGWEAVSKSGAGLGMTLGRLHALGQALRTEMAGRSAGSARFGLLLVGVLLVLALVGWSRHRLLAHLTRDLATAATQQRVPGFSSALLLVAQAAVWSVSLGLLGWGLMAVLPTGVAHRTLGLAMARGVWLGAVVLGGGLLVHTMLRPEGWAERFWGASPVLCRFVRRWVQGGCGATLVLMVPYAILMTAPGDGTGSAESLTLARSCFLLFQAAVLVLVGIGASPRSPLMVTVLARSLQHAGLWHHLWPFVYALLLVIMLASMALNMVGYHYAAQFLWFDTLQSLAVVVGVRLLMLLLGVYLAHRLRQGMVRRGGRLARRYPGFEAAVERALGVYYPLVATLLWILAAALLLEIWGVSLWQFLGSPAGVVAVKRLLLVALTVGVTLAVIKFINILTAFLIMPHPTAQGGTREPSPKLKTLVPLIETLIKIGLVFGVILVILEIVGLDTTPFLTGLGIFGLAVGFASQSLIKDVLNGLFILFEDSVSVGDIATLNGRGGEVEKITLRAITLRGLDGTVSVIPNSTIDVVDNLTKGFSRYVLDVRVKLDEDVDKVMDMLRQIDDAMRQDPAFGPDMLMPLEVWGVDRFEDSGLIIRARLNTKPMRQWDIGREFNRRLQQALKEQGMQMPVPHRMLFWDIPPNGEHAAAPQSLAHAPAPPEAGTS